MYSPSCHSKLSNFLFQWRQKIYFFPHTMTMGSKHHWLLKTSYFFCSQKKESDTDLERHEGWVLFALVKTCISEHPFPPPSLCLRSILFRSITSQSYLGCFSIMANMGLITEDTPAPRCKGASPKDGLHNLSVRAGACLSKEESEILPNPSCGAVSQTSH